MAKQPDRITFEGHTYRLSGRIITAAIVDGSEDRSLKSPPCDMGKRQRASSGVVLKSITETAIRSTNDLANLFECVNITEHRRGHSDIEFRYRSGLLKPPSDFCLERAAEWHSSAEGVEWHTQHGKAACRPTEKWFDVACQQCGQVFATPFPKRAKWCHLNCKMENLHQRREASLKSVHDLTVENHACYRGKRVSGQQ